MKLLPSIMNNPDMLKMMVEMGKNNK